MARPIYTHELADPDYTWLISSFREMNAGYAVIEITGLPVILIKEDASASAETAVSDRSIQGTGSDPAPK